MKAVMTLGAALLAVTTAAEAGQGAAAGGSASPIVRSELIYESAPFPSAHASTIVSTRDGLVAAWFGGTREGAPDVGIWLARHVNGAWTAPVEVATGVQADGTRHPCWNPVLFETAPGTLTLFYKVGPSPQRWWGMVRSSRDNGQNLGRGDTPARRHPRPDQEQAGAGSTTGRC